MLQTFVTNLLNVIVVGVGGIGLIFRQGPAVPATTPAIQIQDSAKQDKLNTDFSGNLSASGSAKFRGTLSGSALFGAALVDCDTANTSKLLYDLGTGKFSCGTDQNSGGSSVNTGALLLGADGRFVNQGGDTMTGSLKVRANVSGSTLNVDNLVSCSKVVTNSSGRASCATDLDTQNLFETIAVSGQSNVVADSPTDTLTLVGGSNVTLTTNAGSDSVTIAATDTNTTYTAGKGLGLAGTTFSLNDAISGSSLTIRGTSSGKTIHAETQLQSSGTTVLNGALTIHNLSSCPNLQTSSTGLFSCNNTSYLTADQQTAGQGLTLTSTSFKVNANLTGTTLKFQTVSGGTLVVSSLKSCSIIVTDTDGNTSCGTAYTQTTADNRYVRLAGSTMTGALKVRANVSGSTLNVDNLRSCDTIDTDSAGRLSCGTDASGGGGSTNTGALMTFFDPRWVNVSGDTMTGALNIVLTGGTNASVALEIPHTLSGRTLHAQDSLRSSGSLVVRGATTLQSTLRINGVTYTFPGSDGSATGKVLKTNGAGQLSWSSDIDTDTNTTYTAGKGLTLTSTAFSLNDAMTGTSLKIRGTASGSIVHADADLRSSGTLVIRGGAKFYSTTNVIGSATFDTNSLFVDATNHKVGILTTAPKTALEVAGAMSGRTLTITTMKSCNLDTDGNGTTTCGTDADTTYTAGQLLTLNGTTFRVNDALTGSSLKIRGTASGSIIHADSQLRSSGTLVVNGRATLKAHTSCTTLQTSSTGAVACNNNVQTLDATLTALAAYNTNGLLTQTSADTFTGRTVTGTSNRISVSNGNGVSGNPTIDIDSAYVGQTTITTLGGLTTSPTAGIALLVRGTMSGRSLWVSGTGTSPLLTTNLGTGRVGLGTSTPKVFFEAAGAMSGQSLTVSILKSCSIVVTDANGATSCGTAYTQTTADARFVNTSGDTMTGALKVRANLSGSTLNGDNLRSCDTIDTDASGRLSCGTDSTTSVTAGKGITIASNVISLSDSISGTLLVIRGNMSGQTLWVSGTGTTATTPLLFAKKETGNVGIGTSTPKAKLDVRGGISGSSLTINGTSTINGTETVTDLACTDCLDFAELADGLSLDATTTVTFGNSILYFNLDNAGDFIIKDNGNDHTRFFDTGTVEFNVDQQSTGDVAMHGQTRTNSVYFDASANSLGIQTATPGSQLAVSGAVIIGTNIGSKAARGALEVIGAMSGTTVYGNSRLLSSGALVIRDIKSNANKTIAQLTGSASTFMQVFIQNTSLAGSGSTDMILGNDKATVTGTRDFIDLGINNSNNLDRDFTIAAKRDGYLYTADGNLDIGTASGKSLIFFTNGTLSANERMRIDSAGNVGIGTTRGTAALDVRGTMSGKLLTVNSATNTSNYILGNLGLNGTKTPERALDLNGGSLAMNNVGAAMADTNGLSFFDGNDDYKIGFDNNGGGRGWIRLNVDTAGSSAHGFVLSAGDVSAGGLTQLAYFRTDGFTRLGPDDPKGQRLEVVGTMSGRGLSLGGSGSLTKIMPRTVTIDFASTAANTCSAATTVTVTGAADGDPVALGSPNGSVGTSGEFFAWVSAANTVSIKHCNVSVGAIDPASGIFKIIVQKF